jgi:sterol desaturase/sphingolipid hydroxylase (fatty acid hydroxylase superfamily)
MGHSIMAFNVAYVVLIVSLLWLEQKMPHEHAWNENDGQFWPNILHTLSSKGTVQGLFLFSGTLGLYTIITPLSEPGYGIWPREWPLIVQVIAGLVAAEFGLYWAHRIAHEFHPLWRFHAVHHSVTRLWIVNTGRFHFIDSLVSIVMAMAILISMGAPHEVVLWVSYITAFIGMLTHCNVEMRFGFLSRIFNTPELHRWHHSTDLREGNKNYGENLMLWDQLFGSYFRDEPRRPPVDIGIKEKDMPPTFLQQLAWPFKDLSTVFPHDRPDWPYNQDGSLKEGFKDPEKG